MFLFLYKLSYKQFSIKNAKLSKKPNKRLIQNYVFKTKLENCFFFTEQGRLDGAVCSYEKKEKFEFLNKAHHECGVLNVEMEALLFSAYCSRYGVKC